VIRLIFDKIIRHFQFKFKDRTAAAIALSEILKEIIKKEDRKGTLVLAIPRGGALTGDIVSKRLSIPNFDIIIPRKLTDPDNKEQAIGAVIADGFTYILDDLVKDFQITEEYLKKETSFQVQQADQRIRNYFQNFQSNSLLYQKVKEHGIILLVDDGIATGATMAVTVKWIRQFCTNSGLDQKRVIIAAPVAPKNITEQIRNDYAVEVAMVFHPLIRSFRSVEQYHQNFEPVTDEQVMRILKERKITDKI
jgi:putative phosphoribosyl transferase